MSLKILGRQLEIFFKSSHLIRRRGIAGGCAVSSCLTKYIWFFSGYFKRRKKRRKRRKIFFCLTIWREKNNHWNTNWISYFDSLASTMNFNQRHLHISPPRHCRCNRRIFFLSLFSNPRGRTKTFSITVLSCRLFFIFLTRDLIILKARPPPMRYAHTLDNLHLTYKTD